MHFPDYQAHSLVNLMSSIGAAFDAPATAYPTLADLPAAQLRDYRTVILLIVDGLGYDYVQAHGTLFKTQCQARLTSVFPSTTATSITTFLTGLAPQQHGLTGWFTYLKEVGGVTAVLPGLLRGSSEPLARRNIELASLYGHTPFFDRLAVRSYVVAPDWIVDTAFNLAHSGQARRMPYTDMAGMFEVITRLAQDTSQQKYIYAYWPDFDRLSHQCGNRSDEVRAHFNALEQGVEQMAHALRDTQTLLMLSADHGFIDTSESHTITVNEHPRLQETLVLPLSGEPRAAYCYVHPDKEDQFTNYLADHFSHQLECLPSRELIVRGAFGLGEPHPCLAERVGHYTLLMKDNYIIKDWLQGEKRFFNIGVHGGVSAQEMYVPLICFTP